MDWIRLDRNENQYGPAPGCLAAIRNADVAELSLYSRDYEAGRKSMLSARLSEVLAIPEENVVLSYGSEDMLKQAVHCYLRPGATMLLPQHSWWYYKSLAAEVDGNQVVYPLVERGNTFAYDPTAINVFYDLHHPDVILIASPNNPTGNSISPEDLESVLHHCADAVIVLDQAYAGFSSREESPMRRLLEQHPRLIVLRTFAKFYALAGLRIGYAGVGANLQRLLRYSARYLGYHRLSEKAALAALDDPEYYRAMAHRMAGDRKAYEIQFSSFPGFTAFSSDANFILVRYQRQLRPLLTDGLRRRMIQVKFLDDPGLIDCMRITIGTGEQNARVRLALGEILQELAPPGHHASAAKS